jgi:hypothetical protein
MSHYTFLFADRLGQFEIFGGNTIHSRSEAIRYRVRMRFMPYYKDDLSAVIACRSHVCTSTVLVRNRDRINISDPLKDTSVVGSPGWIVKDINLYSTTVIYASTNEEATYTNGSLANSRTINMARSFKAQISCTIKFPIDAPYKKLLLFKKSIEQFIVSRPREFNSFVAFRATTVAADLGYVEYVLYALMRESWQEAPSIAQSKADLSSFALELSKKLNLRYRSPPMPVDLTVIKQGSGSLLSAEADGDDPLERRHRSGTIGSMDLNSVAALFEPMR